jgi:transcriptional regulator with XRE-family HTH domain
MIQTNRRASDKRYSGPLADRVRHARRIANLSQAALAKNVGVGPSAVAQWEIPNGTSPTVHHLIQIAACSGVAFEWLSTGRGPISVKGQETPAVDLVEFAADMVEERLLIAFRRIPAKKREGLVRWLEEFF